ncbi:MAG: sugar transferase [Drouetiella hepatica Uher 2000/2452]|jgi:lipopolysaccharide/colanic/teichoic acid biosynthesis glycosyltransferase|uniref:Sugar transferase n=1 Tax=Drouetiella hepatica Uher 2000/2452 TaxID=904376 RepID=A0A951QCG9_9CYAN|nr:sugar transferase [Drouetiella hepatica Uher 2000/2452]
MSDLLHDLHRYLHNKISVQNGLQKKLYDLSQDDLLISQSDYLPDSNVPNTWIPNYALRWRQRKLIVQLLPERQQSSLSSSHEQEWLVACLQNSPVKLVKLDLGLGDVCLKIWAEACRHTDRQAFLRLPAAPNRPQNKKPLHWWLKRRLDWIIAALLLVVLSPVLLSLLVLLQLESSEPAVLRQWCVGERGRLFQCFRFRTGSSLNLTDLGQWLSRLKLDRLPMLLNVLRGEMSLVGSHPFDLSSATQVNLESRCCLNLLPGIVGIQPIKRYLLVEDSKLLSLCDRYQDDCAYLQGWSLEWDLKFLLMVIPKLILTLSAD